MSAENRTGQARKQHFRRRPALVRCLVSSVVAASALSAAPVVLAQGTPAGPEWSGAALLIQRTQALLGSLGYDAGPADGTMTAQTADAIRTYQRDHGLLQDGAPSWTLVAALQDQAQAKLVSYIQARLAGLGYFQGTPDGQDGEATRAAIRAYQQANNQEADGRITPVLLRNLQLTEQGPAGQPAEAGAPPSVTVAEEPEPEPAEEESRPKPKKHAHPKVAAGGTQPASGGERRLAPGDRVSVRISLPGGGGELRPDLVIAPDGSLSLPDGRRVHAAGLRRSQLENAIAMEVLEQYLRALSVKVDVGGPNNGKSGSSGQP